jgi:DHA3 family tetracycline resistance protein-like MFS transporter
VIWFGVINAGTLVLGYLTAEVMGRRLDVSSVSMAARALFVLDALTIAGVLAFAIGAFWLMEIAHRLGELLYLAWLNQGLEPGVRATVISMGSQANALDQVAGGPAIGPVGIRAALAGAAITLSQALWRFFGLVGPVLEGVIRRQMRTNLETLKDLLEGKEEGREPAGEE